MNRPASPRRLEPSDPRQLVRWARRYAQSRTISFLVQWTLIVLMILGTGLTATTTNIAYRDGNLPLVTASALFMTLLIGLLLWFSLSRWGGEIVFKITQWLYGHEGYAAYGENHVVLERATRVRLTALGGGLVAYHLVGALLVTFGYLSVHQMQPFSALYMTPFLCYMVYVQGLGWWAWICPLAYGLHAILLFTGAPIRFTGNYALLNLIVPIFGYGLFAIVLGHLYSRFALWKLKSLARTGLPPDSGDDASPEDA